MREYRSCVIVCFAIFLLIAQIGVVTDVITNEPGINIESSPSSVTITNYIEDPYFTTEPETIVNGTSGEFSSSHHQAVDENDFNYMELTWDHVANTSLDFRIGEDENLPDCFDFIYFYQDFDWPFNEKPIDAELQFNFSTTLTGSFATEEYGNLMFRIYAWTIDSSGNWQQVLKTYPPYPDIYQERRAAFNYFDLVETWEGMIENSTTGIQEDPEDIVQVAIGLAPTHKFETFSTYEDDPWEFYEGSVSIKIKSMDLWVYMDEDPDPSQVLSPIYNSTWDYTVREVFPDIPKEFENSSRVEFSEITTDTNDFVYVLCNVYASYILYVNQSKTFTYQFIQKYNAKLELLWSVRNDNRTVAYGLTIHDGYIYTTGFIRTDDETNSRNLIVTKWSPNGERLWQTEWGGMYDEEGTGIAVSSDGSIYVWAVYWNLRFEPEFWKSSFLKFDSSGTLLWNKTNELPLMPRGAELEMQTDGMYSWGGFVEKRNFNCEPVWNISQSALAVNFDNSGNIYIASYGYGAGAHSEEWQIMISKWNSNGVELWQTNYTIPLPDGRSWIFQCRSIDVAPDGSVLAILHGWQLIYDYHMVKFDSDGNHLWDKIIGDDHWPMSGQLEPKLSISDNGLAYIGFNRLGNYGVEVAVSAFIIGPNTLDSEFPTTMIIGGISVAAVAVVAAVIYIRKYR